MESTLHFFPLLLYYGIDLVAITLFVLVVYNRHQSHELGYVFTFFMFNSIVFFISILFGIVPLSAGFAFGLFAVFGIMRYRTEPVPIREMTYLFGSITLGLFDGVAVQNLPLEVILVPNGAILLVAWCLEWFLHRKPILETILLYDRLDLLRPDQRDAFLADLRERTGFDVQDVKIVRINLRRKRARIRIFYPVQG
ncbi:MAG: DUF4956 domain-containing protein [Candidatus Neomarinimicrobiota bacterium]|nr:MAG: DUF4956 domain-containing protein [Candidatus Neomarinimicrobiota bacterium]